VGAAASGTVTGFGSVYVNEKKFESNNVSLMVHGQTSQCSVGPGNTCGLKEGMTVTVSGSMTNGNQRSATDIRQKDAVEGLVQSVAADGFSLVVLGQSVLVDNATLIDNNIPGQSILNLVGGTDFVEVNGHIRPDGVIQATFIEKKPPGTVTPEVRGFVKGHDAVTKTFQIGNLKVDYATALINDMPNPAGNSWNGLQVEAKGTVFTPGPNVQTQGTLVATKVEPDTPGVQNADEMEVEGFVTQVVGAGDFFIGTTHVQTTVSTEFRGGIIDDIVVGVKVSAEGRLANSILTATHVKFHESVKLEGDIASINSGANTITLTGLSGITVTVNSQTEFKANGGNSLSGLGDLTVNDHIRVRGRLSIGTSVIVTRLELRSPNNDVELQGKVESVSNPNLTILGITVNTASFADNDFQGIDDSPIGRTAFFNAVKVGTLVKVKGRLNGGTVTWREAELED
jgi:hypothetical protein